jgi:hypothetical protein
MRRACKVVPAETQASEGPCIQHALIRLADTGGRQNNPDRPCYG